MFQESELLNLFIAFGAIVILASISKKLTTTNLFYFYAGFVLMIVAYLATVIEGVLWSNFFNFVEHLSLTLVGLAFMMGCKQLQELGKRGKGDEA